MQAREVCVSEKGTNQVLLSRGLLDLETDPNVSFRQRWKGTRRTG
jgi:hypothetical protein